MLAQGQENKTGTSTLLFCGGQWGRGALEDTGCLVGWHRAEDGIPL